MGGTPLGALAAIGDAPSEWYAPRPRSPEEWRSRLSAIGATAGDAWARTLSAALGASGPAAARIRRVIDGGGVVVTTGQQPGLFGGPLYTWSKAMSVLALADALEESTGIPVAPVFWAATDDSDFAESSWTMIARAGGAEELRIEGSPPAGLSMSQVPLGDVRPLIERLVAAAGSAVWTDPLDAVREAYGGSATVGSAYVELLRAILAPLGVAVLDAAHSAVRQAAAPVLRAALRQAMPLAEALAGRSGALVAAGFRPQVAEVAGLSLVFRVHDGERRRIRAAEARTVADAASPDGLSPNVLLRPVVERALLPTAAYVAGPAELAYFAQTGAVADALEVERPLAVPRWSCTIIEPHVERILDRFGLRIDELRDPHAVETRLARQALPEQTARALARLRDAVGKSIAELAADAERIVSPAVVSGAERGIRHRIDRLERRYTAAMKRRLADDLHHIATARGSLFPAGRRQERALNMIPYLARYGPTLIEAMREGASEHAAALLGGIGAGRGAPRGASHAAPTP